MEGPPALVPAIRLVVGAVIAVSMRTPAGVATAALLVVRVSGAAKWWMWENGRTMPITGPVGPKLVS